MAESKKCVTKGIKKAASNGKVRSKKQVLPLLPLRGLTVFPHMILHFDVGRIKSIKALEGAMINNQLIFLCAQKEPKNNAPEPEDVYKIGTICKVKQLLKLPGNTIRVLVEGICRAEISTFTQIDPFLLVEVQEKKSKVPNKENKLEIEALKRQLMLVFEEYTKISNKVSPETALSVITVEDADQMSDIIASNLQLTLEQKQGILDELNPKLRVEGLLKILHREIEISKVENKINMQVQQQMTKTQKDYYLREQLKAIQGELGEKEGIMGEIEEYRQRLRSINASEEVSKKIEKELDRLMKMPPGMAEASVSRSYIEWVLDIFSASTTEEVIDVEMAQTILDDEHYGLDKVKERILEYLSVKKLNNNLKGPILCLVGPPGTGKTSVAKSVARALNRKYVRIALGGVKDESEIRGHRRTYVGAIPGRIVYALKQAGTMNPLILLDELDKMNSDFKGDPAAALLEVLDGEQNNTFRDHFIELPVDLSGVMFLTTANTLDTIPRPLLDRIEVINISSYTEDEKLNIAMKYLLPKQITANGLVQKNIKLEEKTMLNIIRFYTREAGVRNLEREIAKVCRKIAKKMVVSGRKTITVTSKNLENLLGPERHTIGKSNEFDEIGIATGLAWTPVGGDTLFIEVSILDGTGKLELTGQLGDVMKESAKAAVSFIRSIASQLGIDKEYYKKYDIHIHIPEGAIPKDGPSAGITLATSMVSALIGIPVRKNVAMTGEITLRGRILPIGGLKEKVIAAHRAGIDTVIIPAENEKDLEEIPEKVRNSIEFVVVSDMNKVLSTALVGYGVRKTILPQMCQALLHPIVADCDSVNEGADGNSNQTITTA